MPDTKRSQAKYCSYQCLKKSYRLRHPERAREQVRKRHKERYYSDSAYVQVLREKQRRYRWSLESDGAPYPEGKFVYRGKYGKARSMGFRSMFEVAVSQQLKNAGVEAGYETVKLKYVKPTTEHVYIPDFIAGKVYLECKGRLEPSDRKKLLWIRESHSGIDLRLVFERANRPIRKGSPTTYAMWADKHGFKWCEKIIPDLWLFEMKER